MIEIMQFASCHLREVIYNNSLISLTALRVSSRCPVMIEDRKRWSFERLSIRTGNSRQVGRFDTLGEPICPGRTCTRSRTAGKSVGNTGKCCQTGKAEVGTKTEIHHRLFLCQTSDLRRFYFFTLRLGQTNKWHDSFCHWPPTGGRERSQNESL